MIPPAKRMKILDYGLLGLQRMNIMMFYGLQRECGIEKDRHE